MRNHLSLPALFVLLSCTLTEVLGADSLATKAQAVLKQHCFSCHGEGGSNEGGFNFVLNRKRLVRELVVPGDADASKLMERIVKGDMPPDGDRVPKADVATLKQWIEADAPSFAAETQRDFITPEMMLGTMLKDLEKANDRDRPFYRYFTLTHLFNAGFEDNELESHRQGLSKLINSLSWGRDIKVPVPIDSAKTVLRIDLRHYKWNENDAWMRIVSVDPYRVTYSDKAAQACYAMTKCELPHVRADWFVSSASRPPLYHDVLGIPAQVEELEKAVGVNVAKNLIDFNEVQRAAFFPSGVSKSNRLIERHPSTYGAYWKSYDFKPIDPKDKTPKRRDLKANPLGPTACGSVTAAHKFFEHDGGEIIFHLPNGLQGYMLTDAAGMRIDKGPTDVVVDKEAVKRGRDPEVVNGVSCMSCHWSGMLNKTDQVRDHVLARKAAYTPAEVEAISALYAEKKDFAAKLQEDRERFEAAVKKCGAPLAKSEPVSTLAYQFDEPLDLDLAAAEAGVTVAKLTTALDGNASLGRTLGSLTLGQPVPRDTYVQAFGALIGELKIGTFGGGSFSPPLPPQPKDSFANTIGMSLKLIPAGEFLMGSSNADVTAALNAPGSITLTVKDLANEQPQHSVKITKPFYMAAHETTQAQYEQIMGTNPSSFAASGTSSSKVSGQTTSRFPVETVSWFDAVEFSNKLSAKENLTPCYRLTSIERDGGSIKKATVENLNGTGYRLPTEAEWEYACRAKSTTPFHFGSRLNGEEANVDGNYPFGTTIKGPSKGRTTAVGSYSANAFGLYDMHGNVWEWCQDAYYASYFSQRVERDPQGPASSEDRVLHGGSWSDFSRDSRSAIRSWNFPVYRNSSLGFRVVCVSGPRT